MPFALVIIGLVLVVTAVRGTQAQLWNLFVGDITGAGTPGSTGGRGFLVWLVAILAIGALGYYQPLRTPSRLLLALVILGIFLSNEGVLTKMAQAFEQPLPAAAQPQQTAQLPAAIPVQVSQAGGGKPGGPLDAIGDVLGTAAKVAPVFLG